MAKTKTIKKSVKVPNRLISKKLLSKKELVRFGVVLSLAANLVFVGIILIALIENHQGKVTGLTEGYLLDNTCQNYFSKQTAQTGSATKINGVTFMPIYLTSAQQNNKCNNLAEETSFTFQSN